jgi:hypothetical protein
VKAWTGFIWLTTGTSGVLLCIGLRNLGLREELEFSVAEQISPPEKGLSSADLVRSKR